MFFMLLLIGLVFAGIILMMLDVFLYLGGITLLFGVNMGLKICGIILIFTGVALYLGRSYSTGAFRFTPLASPGRTILIHLGKSNAKFLTGKKEEPNRIRARGKGRGAYMNIKDMGDGINIAGHNVCISTQDDGHNVPLWICDLVDKWKNKYGVENEKQLMMLYKEIKNIKSYTDLEHIEFLKPVMIDPEKRKALFDMSLDDLRNMRELLFDGRTINVNSYISWADDATPYDNETIIDSTVAHQRAQDISLRSLGGGDMAKYVIPIVILLICGAIAYQIFGG